MPAGQASHQLALEPQRLLEGQVLLVDRLQRLQALGDVGHDLRGDLADRGSK